MSRSFEASMAYKEGEADLFAYLTGKESGLSIDARFEVARAWLLRRESSRRPIPTNPATGAYQ